MLISLHPYGAKLLHHTGKNSLHLGLIGSITFQIIFDLEAQIRNQQDYRAGRKQTYLWLCSTGPLNGTRELNKEEEI
jgi:hypothetical protein